MIEVYPNALSPSFCRKLIKKFESDPQQVSSFIPAAPEFKKTTVVHFANNKLFGREEKAVAAKISEYYNKYREEHNYVLGWVKEIKDTGYSIDKYTKGEGKDGKHIEASVHSTMNRMHVFKFFLNDVEEGGGLQFDTQDRFIKPEQGTLVIFPPFYTHPHEMPIPESGDQYILSTLLVQIAK